MKLETSMKVDGIFFKKPGLDSIHVERARRVKRTKTIKVRSVKQ